MPFFKNPQRRFFREIKVFPSCRLNIPCMRPAGGSRAAASFPDIQIRCSPFGTGTVFTCPRLISRTRGTQGKGGFLLCFSRPLHDVTSVTQTQKTAILSGILKGPGKMTACERGRQQRLPFPLKFFSTQSASVFVYLHFAPFSKPHQSVIFVLGAKVIPGLDGKARSSLLFSVKISSPAGSILTEKPCIP